MSATLADLLADQDPSRNAIGAPGQEWLSFGALKALSAKVAADLRNFGISAGDRVAIVLPNGPDMAAAFVTIAQAAVTAPLNPAYQAQEYRFYLADLRAKALVVPAGYDGPALVAAQELGMTILRLHGEPDSPAGHFHLSGPMADAPAHADRPGPDFVALILHTSGTTSRPKIVPLLQSNLAASARNIGASLALTPEDRCLNVMPLFHIHGLIAGVTASLAAGASVWCAPGFDALKFFGWMKEAQPSWYTAVPTMHQAILSRAGRNRDVIEAHPAALLALVLGVAAGRR